MGVVLVIAGCIILIVEEKEEKGHRGNRITINETTCEQARGTWNEEKCYF